jgi:hypothetical protein
VDVSHLMTSEYLSNAALQQQAFVGVIEDANEDEVFHRWTGTRKPVIVVTFVDSPVRWIPNGANLRTLVALWGSESDAWKGKRIVVSLRKIEHKNKKTGEVAVRYERIVESAEGSKPASPPAPESDVPARVNSQRVTATDTQAMPPVNEIFGRKNAVIDGPPHGVPPNTWLHSTKGRGTS